MALSLKKRAFINEYFLCNFNGTEAYKRAYGVTDDNAAAASASRLLRDVKIKQEIETRFAERAMSANEVIDRLSQIARGDLGDFLKANEEGYEIDIVAAKIARRTHLVKKLKQRKTRQVDSYEQEWETVDTEIELYSAHEALRDLAKKHALFTEKSRVEDWRTDLIDLLRKGEITPEAVLKQLDQTTALDILREAGVTGGAA